MYQMKQESFLMILSMLMMLVVELKEIGLKKIL